MIMEVNEKTDNNKSNLVKQLNNKNKNNDKNLI